MSLLALLIAAALVFACPKATLAATLIVDPHDPDASDSGTGAAPLKTIGRAAELAGPGDTVFVKAGTYRETILLPRSGRPDAPIRFVSERRGAVIVTGADLAEGWQRADVPEPIFVIHWPFRFVIGRDGSGGPREYHPDDQPLWGRAEEVIADGKLLLPALDLEALRRGWRERAVALRPPVEGLGGPFAGMFAVDTASKRLYVWLADGREPPKGRMEAATRSLLVAPHPARRGRPVTDVSFEGFVFRYAANFPQYAAVFLEGARNMLADCVVERMNGAGLSVHGTLRDCEVRDNGHIGGSAEGSGFLNERTVWEGNSWKPIPREWEAGGVKIAQDGPGEFRDCTFMRNGGPGLWFDLDVHDVVVRSSRFIENEGSGVFIEISRDITVRDSLMAGNATGVVGRKPGGWGNGGVSIAESLRVRVNRNVVRDNLDGVALREQGPRVVRRQDGGSISYRNTDHDITDNEILGNHRYQLAFWWDNGFFGAHPSHLSGKDEPAFDPAAQGLRIDHNRYEAPRGSEPFLYGVPWRPGGRRFRDIDEFARATGFERGGRLEGQ